MNSVFSSVQILEDGTTSTYNNKFLINSAVDDILGEYKCIMKSTLKVHNPGVIILLICINDVQGKELSF